MHTSIALFSLIQSVSQPSLLHTIVESLPRDPASLFTLALLVGVGVLVIVTGRASNGKDGKGTPGGPRSV